MWSTQTHEQDFGRIPGRGNYPVNSAESRMWGELEEPTVGRQQVCPEPRDRSIWAGQLLGAAWGATLGGSAHSEPYDSSR